MTALFLNLFIFLIIFFMYNYFKYKTKTKFSPVFVFCSIWMVVLVNSSLIYDVKTDIINLIFLAILWLSTLLSFMVFQNKLNVKKLGYDIENFFYSNKVTIKRLILFCLIIRILQIIYDSIVINQLGASISMLFGEVQWLRFSYLSYSNNIGIVIALLVNFLNYFSELGLILSALFGFKEKKYFYLLLNIFLSFCHSVLTLSKMSFFIDFIFVLGVFFILSNIIKIEKKERKVSIIGVLFIIFALIITGTQRGYQKQESSIEGIDNVIVSKTVSYFVTPYLAFEKILSEDIDYSYGSKTFSPLYKVFGFDYETFGDINVGFDDSTVYTMPGMFYADFGYFGCIVLMFLYVRLVSYIYARTIRSFTFPIFIIYLVFNVTLVLSFFTWMGRMTFYWIFPVFCMVMDKLFFKHRKEIE